MIINCKDKIANERQRKNIQQLKESWTAFMLQAQINFLKPVAKNSIHLELVRLTRTKVKTVNRIWVIKGQQREEYINFINMKEKKIHRG